MLDDIKIVSQLYEAAAVGCLLKDEIGEDVSDWLECCKACATVIECPARSVVAQAYNIEQVLRSGDGCSTDPGQMVAPPPNGDTKLEMMGHLAGGIVHEINTPMQFIGSNLRFVDEAFTDVKNVIGGYRRLTDAARARGGFEEEIEAVDKAVQAADFSFILDEIDQSIAQSLNGVDHINTIVGSMKEIFHPGAKEKKPVDINKSLRTTITISKNEWKYTSNIETDFAENLPLVNAVPNELNQVFLNLIVNAAHANQSARNDNKDRAGLILIGTRQDGDWVETSIKDTGTGIAKDVRHKVFEPFFTTKSAGGGTGQGLAISRDIIVNRHRGTISFESEEGQGATFLVRLPIRTGEEAIACPANE